ncbi:MAG TPA: alpha/beta hydrolase [Ferrovibrio sp.]|uniref:alpha/beta hydrolase n=1 Tax=Ferrovibrio sp. TaxID=1917215 RepID=UPI002ED47FD5
MKRRLSAAALGLHLSAGNRAGQFLDEYVSVPGREIPIRIYGGGNTGGAPVVVYLHGGGWVSGNLDSHHALCCLLRQKLSATIVSVHTRRAPESPWPAQKDDALDVVRFLQSPNGLAEIGRGGIILAGDSAGAFVAFHAALALGDADLLRGALLFYPALDPDTDKQSYRQYAEAPGLSAENMQRYWNALFAGAADGAEPYRLANLPGLKSLPPICLLAAEHDPLRDDPALLAALLRACGGDVLLSLAAGTTHGFCRFVGQDGEARRRVEEFLETALAFLSEAGPRRAGLAGGDRRLASEGSLCEGNPSKGSL